MIEPTETEDKATLDEFIDVMKKIAVEAKENPDLLTGAPHNAPVSRLDEVRAAKQLVLCCRPIPEWAEETNPARKILYSNDNNKGAHQRPYYLSQSA